MSSKEIGLVQDNFDRNISPFCGNRHNNRGRNRSVFRHEKGGKSSCVVGGSKITCIDEKLEKFTSLYSRDTLADDALPKVQFHDRNELLYLIKLCQKEANIWKTRRVHTEALKKGLIAEDVYVTTGLITSYAKHGDVQEARDIFDHLLVRDVVSWSALISGYVQNGFGDEALECFREMRDAGVSPNAVTYVSILKACAIVGSLEIGEDIDAEVRKQGLCEKDVVLGTALVDMYSKCGAMEEAQKVFEHLPVQDVISWNALITGYAQHGLGNEALKCFKQMKDRGVYPDAVTYICALKSCASVGSLEIGEDIDDEVRKRGFLQKYVIVGNALVDMYSKCGALEKAQEVFEQLPVPDIVSWNALIAGYAQNGLGHEVLNLFTEMKKRGVYPDAVTYVYILKACGIVGSLKIGEDIDAKVRKLGMLQKDVVLGNALLDMYCKCGVLEKALEVFEQLPNRDVVSWNSLIAGYVQNGFGDDAVRCFKEMQKAGVYPDPVTYICVLKSCGILGSLDLGKDLHADIRKQGLLATDVMVGTTLVDMYSKCGAMDEAQEVFELLPERNVVSWSALIAGYAQNGLGNEALKCFNCMQNEGIHPNAVTYVSALKACGIVGCLEVGEEIYDKVRKRGLLLKDIMLGNALVDMYSKCGALEKAQKVFDLLPERNVLSWNALIVGYVQKGYGDEVLECFQKMQNDGVCPDAVTYLCCLRACSVVGSLWIGRDIDAVISKKKLLEKNIMLGTALLDMYSKCGVLEKAQQIFENLPEWNVVAWSALIAGYGQSGQANTAFTLYRMMRDDDILPNLVTFVILFNVCNHAGLVEEGEKLFDEMCNFYGLAPTLEHYTIMIDLFGRAGCFNKVVDMLSKVPHPGYLPMFQSILGSCKKWRNIEFGRWAFQKLIELDERSAASYVCMRNIYAATGTQIGVEEIQHLVVEDGSWKLLEYWCIDHYFAG